MAETADANTRRGRRCETLSAQPMTQDPDEKNVLGGTLQPCSYKPLTGWFRDGCCRTDDRDQGSHLVCAVVTEAFLRFSRARGNDLSTPRPEFQFPGLKEGDRWCLCAARWREALDAGAAPRIVLASTHHRVLEYATIDELLAHAWPGLD